MLRSIHSATAGSQQLSGYDDHACKLWRKITYLYSDGRDNGSPRGEGLMGPKLGFWFGAIARWEMGRGNKRGRGASIENRKSGEKRQQGD